MALHLDFCSRPCSYLQTYTKEFPLRKKKIRYVKFSLSLTPIEDMLLRKVRNP
jgi:hypothetical protein